MSVCELSVCDPCTVRHPSLNTDSVSDRSRQNCEKDNLFTVIQDHRFCHQSKGHVRLPIGGCNRGRISHHFVATVTYWSTVVSGT